MDSVKQWQVKVPGVLIASFSPVPARAYCRVQQGISFCLGHHVAWLDTIAFIPFGLRKVLLLVHGIFLCGTMWKAVLPLALTPGQEKPRRSAWWISLGRALWPLFTHEMQHKWARLLRLTSDWLDSFWRPLDLQKLVLLPHFFFSWSPPYDAAPFGIILEFEKQLVRSSSWITLPHKEGYVRRTSGVTEGAFVLEGWQQPPNAYPAPFHSGVNFVSGSGMQGTLLYLMFSKLSVSPFDWLPVMSGLTRPAPESPQVLWITGPPVS